MKLLQREIPAFLNSVGINYHATGTIDHTLESGKVIKVYDFYKVDKISIEQINQLKARIPDCTFRKSMAQYAPEQKSVLVCIPKKAFYTYNMTGF